MTHGKGTAPLQSDNEVTPSPTSREYVDEQLESANSTSHVRAVSGVAELTAGFGPLVTGGRCATPSSMDCGHFVKTSDSVTTATDEGWIIILVDLAPLAGADTQSTATLTPSVLRQFIAVAETNNDDGLVDNVVDDRPMLSGNTVAQFGCDFGTHGAADNSKCPTLVL